MPVEVSTHPDFLARQATYNAERRAAETAGDEAAQERARANWQAAMNQMQVELYERQNSERDRQARIAQIRAENPAAPEEIFAGGDLDQIERAAKAVQSVAGQRGGQWSPPPNGGSGSPGEPDPSNMTPMQREEARRRELDEVSRGVMRRGRHGDGAAQNAERMMELSLQPLINKEALEAYREKQAAERREGRQY